MGDYEVLVKKLREISVLGSVNGLLGWDMEVLMPKGEAEFRSEQQAMLARMTHEMFTDKKLGALMRKVSKQKLTTVQRIVIDEVLDDYERSAKVPKELVEELERASSKSFIAWEKAKKANDFKSFAPHIKELLRLNTKVASLTDPELPPYESMLRGYDKDVSLKEMRSILSDVKTGIKPVIRKAKIQDTSFLARKVPVETQRAFNKWIAGSIGFDFNLGRLDESTHPFTSDSRITTRYDHGWFGAISATMHEAGHGMYDMGIPREHMGTPLGSPVSMSMHESQSRIWENHVGKGLAFWKYYYPKLQKAYKPALNGISLEKFYHGINNAQPSLIRVEADELTYPMHIILRFEMEQDLISGKMTVDEIPAVWNSKMKDSLGIVPKNDVTGCLQDVHWSQGYFGYFPTYVLGSMMSAQIYNAAKKQMPTLETQFAHGNTKNFLAWLRTNIHQHGRRYKTNELLKRVTGKSMTSDDYVEYLKGKFGRG